MRIIRGVMFVILSLTVAAVLWIRNHSGPPQDGVVMVTALISQEGMVIRAFVQDSTRSDHHPWDEAAITELKQTEFSPATVNGRPIAVWVVIPMLVWNNETGIWESRIGPIPMTNPSAPRPIVLNMPLKPSFSGILYT